MENWSDFFVATAGASAALAGFIFVSVSISLKQILSFPKLPHRTLESLLFPINVLLVSCCGLVPNQSPGVVGSEILCFGLIMSGITFRLNWIMLQLTPVSYKRAYRINFVVTQISILPYWIAGFLVLETGWAGVYWLVPAILLSFLKAIYDAWLLLIEINR